MADLTPGSPEWSAQINATLAEVWDAGYQAGWDDAYSSEYETAEVTPNPYKQGIASDD